MVPKLLHFDCVGYMKATRGLVFILLLLSLE
jgi:hypothetical protein